MSRLGTASVGGTSSFAPLSLPFLPMVRVIEQRLVEKEFTYALDVSIQLCVSHGH